MKDTESRDTNNSIRYVVRLLQLEVSVSVSLSVEDNDNT